MSIKGIPYHSNIQCYFLTRPYRFCRSFLSNFSQLKDVKNKFGFCTCFEFAWIIGNPSYANVELTETEFIDIASNAGYLYDEHFDNVNYTIGSNEGMVFIDSNISELMAEYKPSLYQDLFEYTKTPKEGHMYRTLLGYCYPEQPMRKEHFFVKAFEESISEVFDNLDSWSPSSLTEVINDMPKNTSAGYISLRMINKRRKKDMFLSEIISEYKNMKNSVLRNRSFPNHTMFAMRGHLSPKTKVKTRPIWLASAETIVAEKRFADGLYRQFDKPYFHNRMIHGEGALRRLRKYLQSNSEFYYTNTDISGWDAFRCVFLHKRLFQEIEKKIEMSNSDRKLYRYTCFESNIYARVAFPSGSSFKTNGGLKTGSGFTLAQNTLLNMILTLTALKMMGLEENIDYVETSWLGDDFSIKTRRPFEIDKFSNLLMKYFSLLVKEEKCFFADPDKDRKFLGYEIRGGLLFKDLKELWAGSLYTESYFKRDFQSIVKSFTRLFSYVILGGYNNIEFMDFFYLFCGQYGSWLDKVEYIFDDRSQRLSRVLKDIFNVNISKFNSDTFKNMKLYLSKYILLYDYDFIDVNKELL